MESLVRRLTATTKVQRNSRNNFKVVFLNVWSIGKNDVTDPGKIPINRLATVRVLLENGICLWRSVRGYSKKNVCVYICLI